VLWIVSVLLCIPSHILVSNIQVRLYAFDGLFWRYVVTNFPYVQLEIGKKWIYCRWRWQQYLGCVDGGSKIKVQELFYFCNRNDPSILGINWFNCSSQMEYPVSIRAYRNVNHNVIGSFPHNECIMYKSLLLWRFDMSVKIECVL
jgi:hypothetical protein